MAKRRLRVELTGPRPPLGIVIDRTGTALYVQVSNQDVADTREIEPGLLADYDVKGRLVGFEVIGLGRERVGQVFAKIRAKYESEAPNLAQLDAISHTA